ncbi:MAG: tetratricopeptide repeat protein [Chitinophagaceae bacterium]|jgi:Tfp pilus assembly protein PilF|nr:tetratricopeptide repeat protein [Chitinophagaceae bacterium]
MNRIEKLLEYLQASPEDSFLQHALALEYVKAGNDAIAAGYFTRLLAQNPGYVGSYYHLAKLYERKGEVAAAIATYNNGMQQAKLAGDMHALNELRSALEDLEDD